MYFFFFKQKTAYEMRISDWSSDVCSSDLALISAIDRALHPCAQTLQFTREGPAQLNLQRFDLRDLLTEVREAVAEVGAGRAGWINAVDRGFRIEADRGQLYRGFFTLAHNPMDPGPGPLRLTPRAAPDSLWHAR